MGRRTRMIGAGALAVGLGLAGAPGATAAEVLDQHFESTNDPFSIEDEYMAAMQTFTAGRSGPLDEVDVLVSQDGSLSGMLVYVFDVETIEHNEEYGIGRAVADETILVEPIGFAIIDGEEVSTEEPAWVTAELEVFDLSIEADLELPELDGEVVRGEDYGIVVLGFQGSLEPTSAAASMAALASGDDEALRTADVVLDGSALSWWGDEDGGYDGGEAHVLFYESGMPVGGDLSFRTYVDSAGSGTSHAAIDGFGDWLASLCEDGGPWWCASID